MNFSKDNQAIVAALALGITVIMAAGVLLYQIGRYSSNNTARILQVEHSSEASVAKTNDSVSSLTVLVNRDNLSINKSLKSIETKVDVIEATYVTKNHFYHYVDMVNDSSDANRNKIYKLNGEVQANSEAIKNP